MHSFFITIWGNSQFGSEFAYFTAENTGKSVLLFDADLLAPSVDKYLCVERCVRKAEKTGIDLAVAASDSGTLTPSDFAGFTVQRKGCPGLAVITGNYDLNNYEYFDPKTAAAIIKAADSIYNVIIMAVNKNIYDSFTLYGLNFSDLNLIAVKAGLLEIREYNAYISFLCDKQNIPAGKYLYVTYEYDKHRDLDERMVFEMTKGRYLGSVSESQKRGRAFMTGMPYAVDMDPANRKEYGGILSKMGKQFSLK